MEMTCGQCGRTFIIPAAWARRGGGKFCGRACYAQHQREHPHTTRGKVAKPSYDATCRRCGKTFRTRGGGRDRKYCSSTCQYGSVPKVCETCGENFSIPRSYTARGHAAGRFCSQECKFPDAKILPCARCGTIFDTRQGRLTYCSEECRRPAVMVDCRECGKTFRAVPSLKPRFCSPRCYRRHTGETEPEGNVRRALETLGVTFEQEATVAGWRYPVDFLLLDTRTILEVDGVYWHARTKDRDARKDLHMQSAGFVVVRIPDTGLYGDLAAPMIDTVRAAIAVAEKAVPVSDMGSLYPVQLALPLNQEGMVGR